MKYKVYIQAFNNFPIADWAVSAYMGFREKQMDIIFFEDIDEVPVSKYNILVAYIEETNKYLEKLGIERKRALNIPIDLFSYAGRELFLATLGDLRKGLVELPIFVKPAIYSKAFIAGVITKPETIYAFKDFSDDTELFFSEVIDIVSEYRGYVIDGELKGLKHYMGNIRIFPDVTVIDNAISSYKNAPVGYSIDFGITRDGRTLLIECNDGWSLGNYGLNDVTYSTLLAKRWIELTKSV